MAPWPPPGSFAHQMLGRVAAGGGIPHFTAFAKQIWRLTSEHLDFLISLMVAAKFNDNQEPTAEFSTFGVSAELLRFFLGDAWTDEHVFECHAEVRRDYRKGRAFLATEQGDTEARFRWQQRVTSLAECLYNLQGVPGIDQRIAALLTGDLESALGELECAKMVARFQLRFVVPVAKKGSDYEMEFVSTGGRLIHCEVKTKQQTTELSQGTIRNTLNDARAQLPKGKPGIVFLRIPEQWPKQPNSLAVVQPAIENATRQSDRLVAIVMIYEEWEQLGGGRRINYRHLTFPNRKSSHYGQDIDETISVAGSHNNPFWVPLGAYISNRMPFLEWLARSWLTVLDAAADEQWQTSADASPDLPLAEPGIPEPTDSQAPTEGDQTTDGSQEPP